MPPEPLGGRDPYSSSKACSELVTAAYRESFAEFDREHPDIEVRVNVVPYKSYFDSLRTDVAGGGADDVFWLSNAYFAGYADNGAPGERADNHPGYNGAFVLDPDGHNIEAVNHNRTGHS